MSTFKYQSIKFGSRTTFQQNYSLSNFRLSKIKIIHHFTNFQRHETAMQPFESQTLIQCTETELRAQKYTAHYVCTNGITTT